MKRLPHLLLPFVLTLLPALSWAQSFTVTATPQNCANVTGIGTDNWSNPGNATTSNNTSATVSLNDNEISRYLRCSNYGFAIPSSATITGISVSILRNASTTNGNPRDSAVQLLKAGTLQSTNLADTGTTYPTTLTTASYGGASTLWGSTWTAADINATDFGVSFVATKAGTAGGALNVNVDAVSMSVTYDLLLPCTPPTNIPAGVSVTCVCDTFNRSSLDPSTIFGQNWITSESDNTGILPSIAGNAVLRLTDSTGNKAKAATVPAAFPAAGNYISVEFNHYAYNGSGADGIAVTLSDYSVTASPGAYGGSLGYAQQTNIDGFAAGWIGVAIDEYGNYQNPTEGRSGGPGFRQDSVGIRGSGSGRAPGQYPWVAGTAANLSPGIDNAGSTTRAPGHRYQIVVDARSAGTSPAQTLVAVNRDTGGTGTAYGPLINAFNIYQANPAQAPVPANWQISFTGSTGGSTNIHEVDSLRICASTIVPPSGGVPSGFSVIDEAYGNPSSSPITALNYLQGRIYAKLAGSPFRLNVAAINNNQIQTGYVLGSATKTVNVRLVDNSDGVCVLNNAQPNYCSAACQAKATSATATVASQAMTFASSNAGQKQSTDFTIPGAWSNLVALVSDGTTVNPNGVWACSTDAFSVRPLNFNALSSSASNAALTGTPALRAGSDTFSMMVGTATDGYAGAAALPTINPAGVAANVAGWAVGSISPGSFPAATSPGSDSFASGSTFTYSEVGNFRFLGYDPATNTSSARGIHDSTWTSIDQSTLDCISGSYANTRDTSGSYASNSNYGKYGCLFGLSANSAYLGRFYPHHFTLVSGNVTPTCPSTTVNTVTNRPHSYMGQTLPSLAYRLEARNGQEGVTQNYAVGRAPVVLPTIVAEDLTTGNEGCNLGSRLVNLPTISWTAGVSEISTTTARFNRPGSTAPGTLNASSAAQCTATRTNAGNPFWNLDIGVQVNDSEVAITGADMNPGSTGSCSGSSCNARKLGSMGMVLGRLNLLNAYGSDALALLVPVRAEFWNGGGWQLNVDDRCTTLAAANLAVGNVTPASGSALAVSSGNVTLSTPGPLSNGTANFRINPGSKGAGSVDLVLNLGTGVDANADWCGSWANGPISGTGTVPGADLSHLLANWCGTAADRAPAARIRFGNPNTSYIYLRERY